MDQEQFWKIIEAARVTVEDEDGERHFDVLKSELLKLPPGEIVRFGHLFHEAVGAAYKNDLWGAAYWINGGASDDGFHYFRCWLVGEGRDVYEKALEDPDSLAEVVKGESYFEAALDSAAVRAWTEKTGRTDEAFYAELERLGSSSPGPEEGEDWDFDDEDEMQRRLPRLYELYKGEEEE